MPSVKTTTHAAGLPCPIDRVDHYLGQPSPEATAVLARHEGDVLVLGAGGKLGLPLSIMLQRALSALGRPTALTAVSRFQTLRDRSDFDRFGIATHAADLCDPAALAALPDAPTVFFLAGVKFGTATAPELLRRVNVELPRLVAERFHQSRIVAFSTGCVYPFLRPDSGGATEATPPAPVGDYAASCLAREVAFAGVSLRQGARVALIRLNYSVEFRYGLLVDIAQKVLRGETRGYQHHPQLLRFARTKNPAATIAAYLQAVRAEAVKRDYHFDATKIGARRTRRKLTETRGQLLYEWLHLKRKLKQRDPARQREVAALKNPQPHPLFRIVPGKVREWEKVK